MPSVSFGTRKLYLSVPLLPKSSALEFSREGYKTAAGTGGAIRKARRSFVSGMTSMWAAVRLRGSTNALWTTEGAVSPSRTLPAIQVTISLIENR